MMSSYLVTLKPLEPYFFGGERNFDYGANRREIKQSYFIRSLTVPSQTTLLGTLRYAVLAANGALITDFADEDQRGCAEKLVGGQSFSFEEPRLFGTICGLSSLFLKIGDSFLVPMPMNHAGESKAYTPLRVGEVPSGIQLSAGGNLAALDYQVKKGCGGGWIDLTTGTKRAEEQLFQREVRVGINAQRTEAVRKEEESYFKKEVVRLREGSFAFFAELELEKLGEAAKVLEGGIPVAMGQNKSAFLLQASPRENDLEEKIKNSLGAAGSNRPFWYAPGDCCVTENPAGFHIADTGLFRHLSTAAVNEAREHPQYYYRWSRTEKLYRIMRAGAVFYDEERPSFAGNDICRRIGMNYLIKIGER